MNFFSLVNVSLYLYITNSSYRNTFKKKKKREASKILINIM